VIEQVCRVVESLITGVIVLGINVNILTRRLGVALRICGASLALTLVPH
jgi:hypothetical protein